MRCPRCGAEADYGPFYRDFHPDDFYYVDYECTECGWEGDDAILAYSEDFGLDPFKDDVAEVMNYLAIGTVEAYKNALSELRRVIERRTR
jgi:hypothetical protein